MTAVLGFPWVLAAAVSVGGALVTLGLLSVFARGLSRRLSETQR